MRAPTAYDVLVATEDPGGIVLGLVLACHDTDRDGLAKMPASAYPRMAGAVNELLAKAEADDVTIPDWDGDTLELPLGSPVQYRHPDGTERTLDVATIRRPTALDVALSHEADHPLAGMFCRVSGINPGLVQLMHWRDGMRAAAILLRELGGHPSEPSPAS